MKRITRLISVIILFTYSLAVNAQKIEDFEFVYNGNLLSGLIESPVDQIPQTLVIIVPGSGRTNFIEGNSYIGIRDYFVSQGIACCFWDKTGCGKSEGIFDSGMEHPISKSADEIITAVKELRKTKDWSKANIGLWGHSRAGWICPWVIEKDSTISFWISVSSPDDNDQSVYQLASNLKLNGYNEHEVKLLTGEYWAGETIFQCGGTYEEYCRVTPNMRKDSICSKQSGKTVRDKYNFYQKKFLDLEFSVDCETGRVDGNPGFREAVSRIKCPVLALFGENDSQVNWRNTINFYKESFGSLENADLTIKTFQNCNHNMQYCKTGASSEDLSEYNFRLCDGYYDAMSSWIEKHGYNQ